MDTSFLTKLIQVAQIVGHHNISLFLAVSPQGPKKESGEATFTSPGHDLGPCGTTQPRS